MPSHSLGEPTWLGEVPLPEKWQPRREPRSSEEILTAKCEVAGGELRAVVETRLQGTLVTQFAVESSPYQIVVEAWGSWPAFRRQYPTDRAVWERMLTAELPSDSGLWPLFPAPKNYQQEFAWLAIRSIVVDRANVRTIRGQRYEFIVCEGKEVTSMFVVESKSGMQVASWMLLGLAFKPELVDQLCSFQDQHAHYAVVPEDLSELQMNE